MGLKRLLGLNSYQTAWSWLHRMRLAMERPRPSLLSGRVEVDETLIGAKDHSGKRGRGAGKKSIVAIAIEVHEPMGFGRVGMKRIPNVKEDNLIPFICSVVAPGSNVLTDSWLGYNDLEKSGYKHDKINISESGDPANVNMPSVHRVSSLLKRWLLGTHQGAVSEKHLDYYLDEYTFRFNRRTSKARGLLFYRLLQQAVAIPPTTYKEIVRD